MGIPIEKFIINLETVRDEGLLKTVDKEIKDIFYIVLYDMAKTTITDTGQARSAIIDEYASKYGYNASDLFNEFYGFWEKHGFPDNSNRGWGNANTSYSDKFDGKTAKVKLKINDEGLFAQENADAQGLFEGHLYPSEVHSQGTGRDNSQYKPRHITKVSDGYMNNPQIEQLLNEMVKKIEKRLFKI